ncbi:40S ribosomal protein S20-like 2 [Homarus americanus]|uniref:40S ribosomal protein S20-like 1 n=1 Tax=Homarus americanus TaxID=6706 RepID=A0A8J5JF35_HOMAM|nr:40S ribosomal protein S20-like 1 [Homarus americanus]KAG7171394.1 40S ribosomal protein S20-like 2 [Homarus americanus]
MGDGAPIHRIRITLTSSTSSHWRRGTKDKQLKVKGPVRMPTKTSRITTRKTPALKVQDLGSFQMRIQSVSLISSPSEVVKQITSINIEPDVDVEVTIAE